MRAAAVVAALFAGAPAPADDDGFAFDCAAPAPPAVDFRITYGPNWDGAWRLTATRGDAQTPPRLVFEILDVDRVARAASVVERHERPAAGPHLRSLRNASGIIIAEMQRLAAREEIPELRSEQRRMVVQVAGSQGTMCADGFANWPRLPGAYYFAAVELVIEWVRGVAPEPWTAVALQLQQVRAPWK